MNFPVGNVVSKGVVPFDVVSFVNDSSSRLFNGYLILSVKSHFVEEGVLFFRDGSLVGCIVECLALNRTIKGDASLEFFLNQTKGNGFFQVVELSKSQIDLITAFDEKLLLSQKLVLKDLPKLIPNTFSDRFVPSGAGADLLEAYGLSDLKN